MNPNDPKLTLTMIVINRNIRLKDHDIELKAIRAQGAGGQNINKVASAIQLRFDVKASSLSDTIKQRLLASNDGRITKDGVLIIKAQQFRTQEKNKSDALKRLQEFILKASQIKKPRKPTQPSKRARRRRMDKKSQRGQIKRLRAKVDF